MLATCALPLPSRLTKPTSTLVRVSREPLRIWTATSPFSPGLMLHSPSKFAGSQLPPSTAVTPQSIRRVWIEPCAAVPVAKALNPIVPPGESRPVHWKAVLLPSDRSRTRLGLGPV
jgi:hypothetical protein